MEDGKAVRAKMSAERRVSRVLRDLRQVGKLPRQQFTEVEVSQIFSAIEDELAVVRQHFAPQQTSYPEFKFGSSESV